MGSCVFTPPHGMSGANVRDVFRLMGLKTGACFVDPLSDEVYVTVSDPDEAYRVVDGLHAGRIALGVGWTGRVKSARWIG